MIDKWDDEIRNNIKKIIEENEWKNKIKSIKKIFENVEGCIGATECHQNDWRQHWDHQLKKALKIIYYKQLHNYKIKVIYNYINLWKKVKSKHQEDEIITIKLIYNNNKLDYEPLLEDLRMRFYRDKLNEIINWPLELTGISNLSEDPGYFKDIIDEKCSRIIISIYNEVENQFYKLKEELKKYNKVILTILNKFTTTTKLLLQQTWISVVDALDLEQYFKIDNMKMSDEEWQMNLEELENKLKESEHLSDYAKCGYFKINLIGFKKVVKKLIYKKSSVLLSYLNEIVLYKLLNYM